MLFGDAIQIDLDFLTRIGCEPDKIAHIIGDLDNEIIAADVFKKVEGTLQQFGTSWSPSWQSQPQKGAGGAWICGETLPQC